jgi:hypothetical protein
MLRKVMDEISHHSHRKPPMMTDIANVVVSNKRGLVLGADCFEHQSSTMKETRIWQYYKQN